MNDKPLVTVIVPAYNHEKYVVECLDSIYNQTYKEFQWIVVDDGSKDNTPNILKSLQHNYGYELILQENHGLSWTLTNVIKHYAKGEYISICASDDKWLPNKLKQQIEFMEENSEFAMCYGRTKYMDLDSNVTRLDNRLLYKSGDIFEDLILKRFHPPVNYLYRKDILAEIGYFPSGVIAEDFYMNCKIAEKYPIGFIDEFLSIYREAPLQTKRDPLALMESHKYTIDLYANKSIYREAISYFYLRGFNILGSYKKYKLLALKYLLNVRIREIVKRPKLMCKGFYHFLICWD